MSPSLLPLLLSQSDLDDGEESKTASMRENISRSENFDSGYKVTATSQRRQVVVREKFPNRASALTIDTTIQTNLQSPVSWWDCHSCAYTQNREVAAGALLL
jgi:hypothetical protein